LLVRLEGKLKALSPFVNCLDNFKTAYATATKIAQKNHHQLGIVVHGVKGFRNMVRSEKHDPELLTQRKDPKKKEKTKKK